MVGLLCCGSYGLVLIYDYPEKFSLRQQRARNLVLDKAASLLYFH